jgi:hypothetical protein
MFEIFQFAFGSLPLPSGEEADFERVPPLGDAFRADKYLVIVIRPKVSIHEIDFALNLRKDGSLKILEELGTKGGIDSHTMVFRLKRAKLHGLFYDFDGDHFWEKNIDLLCNQSIR